MGRLRAANGHPKPYNVRHWEIGNELWGRWQYHWTTAEGYVDRYRQFVRAVLAVDPTIEIYACGAPVMWGKAWNDTLIAGAADLLRITTDHPLIGGQIPADTDPLDVFRDFMAVPEVLEQKWAGLEKDMKAGGIGDPRLAVTELQMFGRIRRASSPDAPRRLTHETLVSPATHAEALYNVLIYHSAVRLAPFVTMVTHSATVNHGGGLRKSRERVFANPCHYGQAMFAALAEAVPLKIELTCAKEKAPTVVPDLRRVAEDWNYRSIDALAARGADGDLLLSIVHKGTDGPVEMAITLKNFRSAGQAEIQTLAAETPWAANTLENPDDISPIISRRLMDYRVSLSLPPFSYKLVRIPTRR